VRDRLESVAEAQRLARKRLPKPVYVSLVGGRENGRTRDLNVSCFDDLAFRARVVVDMPPVRELGTTVLGQDLSMPVLIAPVGAHAVVPDGELPVARASAKAGVAICQSNFANSPFEEVAAANPMAVFQLFWAGTLDEIAERVERMKKAGAKALIYTADSAPYAYHGSDWGAPAIPHRIDLAAAVRYAPTALAHPRWLLDFLRHGGFPEMRVPNMAVGSGAAPRLAEAVRHRSQTPAPTWKNLAWLREVWGGPFLLKGILTPDDARRAVDIGATAVSVSNHGGNVIDGAVPAIRALPSVVDAVGDQIEVLLDGGVRRGNDVAKALALGARAVLIGRAWLYGLAARGERGVDDVLTLLRLGLDNALVHLGHRSIDDLGPSDLVIPEGFSLKAS